MVTAELYEDPGIRAYLLRLIGNDGLELLKRFPESGEHSDEDLAEKTTINLNTVRHTLYTLYERRLAEYRRIKNPETGWLTYLWHLNLDRVPEKLDDDLKTALEKLETRLRYEDDNDFYLCSHCGRRVNFSEASEVSFVCPHCDEQMEHFDNNLLVTALKQRVDAIKESLGCA